MNLIPSGINPQEKGRAPEGCGQKEINMLSVTEKPEKASLLSKVDTKYVTASPDKRAAEWVESRIAKSQAGIIVEKISLTPAIARALLNRNDDNRRVSEANVEAFARDVANDAWALNGHTIVVSKCGKLNDGQHRCLAVERADKSIDTVIIFGAERETRTTLDQGRLRSLGDFLGLEGYTNANILAAAAGYVWQYTNRGNLSYARHDRPTKGEVLRFVNEHPNIVHSVARCMRKEADAVGGKSVIAFCHWVFAQKSKAKFADEFIDGLMFGESLDPDSPILYARNRLVTERGKLRPAGKAELIIKAWNAWRRDTTLRRIVISVASSGRLPEVEG